MLLEGIWDRKTLVIMLFYDCGGIGRNVANNSDNASGLLVEFLNVILKLFICLSLHEIV